MLLTDMKNSVTRKIATKSPEETEHVGKTLAANLKGGEIIELSSDLGGGKTTFTKGLARGLGVKQNVTSPTFVISKIFKGSIFELHHYDFYRLGDIGVMSEELQEVLENEANITVIEWAGDAHKLLPENRLVRIELFPQENKTDRELVITLSKGQEYILEGLQGLE